MGTSTASLRVAVVWGTSVVALRTLERGASFVPDPIPDGIEMADPVLRGGDNGQWDLDPRGCIGGLLTIRGRGEDPSAIARLGAKVPISAGDFGLVQYGQLAIFFQYDELPILTSPFTAPDWLSVLSFFSSATLHIGVLALLRTLLTPSPLPRPPELADRDEWAARFGLHRPVAAMPEPIPSSTTSTAESKRAEPAPSASGGTRSDGPPRAHAGRSSGPSQSDVLEGSTAGELRGILGTLGTLPSVSSRLGALDGKMIIRDGAPNGGRLKGVGDGDGRSDGFRAGDLDTTPTDGGAPEPKKKRESVVEAKVMIGVPVGPAESGLRPEQVRHVVLSRLGTVRACYETEAAKTQGLKGGVTLSWTIDPSGAVTGAAVTQSSLASPRVGQCIVRHLSSWHFPVAPRPTHVASFPFRFDLE